MTNLVPLATAVLAALVLGEALTPQMIVGLLIATLGVFIVQSRPSAQPARRLSATFRSGRVRRLG
jgi:drug/metabolite transporter (DMT)-like permease